MVTAAGHLKAGELQFPEGKFQVTAFGNGGGIVDADIDELIGQAEEQISQYESQAQEAIEEATELINELQ